MWLKILIVCVIFGFLSNPVDRFISKKVSSKWLSLILRIFVYWAIFTALYGIAALLGLYLLRGAHQVLLLRLSLL